MAMAGDKADFPWSYPVNEAASNCVGRKRRLLMSEYRKHPGIRQNERQAAIATTAEKPRTLNAYSNAKVYWCLTTSSRVGGCPPLLCNYDKLSEKNATSA